ncbi:MAG: hypothetical protein JWO38_7735 [Gemmataceae bacterium]|nr:hypothetical protein [Gemmataceae bacterium]
MPIHDWARVSPGTFHNFHYRWLAALCDALNAGGLPDGYFAMAEQRAGGPIPDILTLHLPPPPGGATNGHTTGPAVATAPPQTRFVVRSEVLEYARRANRITIRDDLGQVVAVIEVVSPGNKDSRNAIRAFVGKIGELVDHGIHLVVVDLFPPGPRDPQGIHKAIWDEIGPDQPFDLPKDKPLTVAAYEAESVTAYVEPVAVGDVLPGIPLFLTRRQHVRCPLEASYQAAWGVMPAPIRRLFDPPAGGP